MRLRNLLLFFFVMVFGHSLAQKSFRYKRDITGIDREGWYELEFPGDIFWKLNTDLSDFRLYNVNGRDSVEVPWLLDIRHEEVTSETVELSLINQSLRSNALFVMFELKDSQKVNYLDLRFEPQDFFGLVTIEGSDNRLEWFEIARDERIVSLTNRDGDYSLSTINFPVTDYRFLRLRITSDASLVFKSASFQYHKLHPGQYHSIPATWKINADRKTKQSIVEIRMINYVPLSTIEIQVDSIYDFYRPLRVEVVRDSTATEKGWIKYYETVYEGFLTSFKPNDFKFGWKLAKDLRLVITDFDNPPITIQDVALSGPDVRVISPLKPGYNIMLYGAEYLTSPTYDLAYFENNIPDSVSSAQLGPEQPLMNTESTIKPLFENKIWLWGIMGVMIGGLGFFTMKMMNGKR